VPVDQRLAGSVAAETAAILKGAHIIRTHDVKASVDMARMADVLS
jgi:dihydropteroate synthase